MGGRSISSSESLKTFPCGAGSKLGSVLVPPFQLPERKTGATSRLGSKAAGSTRLEASAGKDGNKTGGVCGSRAVGSSQGDVINECVLCGMSCAWIVSGERSVWGHVGCAPFSFPKQSDY